VSTQLLEKQPPITVDRNGGLFLPSAGHLGLTLSLVGTIGHQTKPSANARPNSLLGITLPVHLFTRSKNKNKEKNMAALPELRLPSRQEYPPQRLHSSPRDDLRSPISPNPFIHGPPLREDESPQERSQREQEEVQAKVVSDTIDKQIKQDEVAFKRYQKAIKVLLLGQSESG